MNNDEIRVMNTSDEPAAPLHESDSSDFDSGFDENKTIVREVIRETPVKIDEQQVDDGFSVVFKEPKRLALFILSIVIALALIIAGGVLIGTKSDEQTGADYGAGSSYKTITTDASETVYVNNVYQYFKFVPQTSGTYSFYTVSGGDTCGQLYDSSFVVLTSDDDSGNGNNFKISRYLTSGVTYYIGVRSYGSSFSCTLYVIKV
ncbi:MAG: hypothetical protein J5781_04485 [Clostridia bacterium]|nr:hypothetical protein [Clostridia bacterium]